MLPSGWCSDPGLGNGEELAPSLPSRCYPWAGKQSRSFSADTVMLRRGEEVQERRAGMDCTAEGAGKPTAQDLFDAALFFRRRSREDVGSRSTKLLLVSSCPGRLARAKQL